MRARILAAQKGEARSQSGHEPQIRVAKPLSVRHMKRDEDANLGPFGFLPAPTLQTDKEFR